jgi:menaquinol-cytochrome c reductase iron-sulfur subunit
VHIPKEVFVANSHSIGRRDFVKIVLTFLGTVMGGILALPAISYLVSPATKVKQSDSWISLGPVENYEIGKPILFSFTKTTVNGWERTVNSYGAYVLRQSPDQIKVFSNMCTHLSCRVTWQEEAQKYICPCHDGHFAKEGHVLAGPPPDPLHEYETKLEDGNLFLHHVEG